MGAGNKFATMLSRNTSRMTVVLVYVFLEWVLIVLLLLNSLLSYLIRKFAAYFGLKPPCPWCSRVDHVLESCRDGGGDAYIESVCEAHAKEISRLGYCLKHRRLVEACRTCEDCSLSRGCQQGSVIASVSLVAQIDDGDNEEELRCSCCGAGLNDGFYTKYFLKRGLFKPSWDVLGDAREETFVIGADEEKEWEEEEERKKVSAEEDADGDKDDDGGEKEERGDAMLLTGEGSEVEGEEAVVVDEPLGKVANGSITVSAIYDPSCNIMNFKDSCDYRRLVPVDFVTEQNMLRAMETCRKESNDAHLNLLDSLDFDFQSVLLGNEGSRDYFSVLELQSNVVQDCAMACSDENNAPETIDAKDESDGMAIAEQTDGVREGQDLTQVSPSGDQIATPVAKETIDIEENSMSFNNGIIHQEPIVRCSECTVIPLPTSSHDGAQKNAVSCILQDRELEQTKESAMEEVDGCFVSEISCVIEKMEERMKQLSLDSKVNDIEEERAPETPTYIEGIQSLHKKLMIERKESGIESVDGSVISETEGIDAVVCERLKASLREERRALNALYAELEEERSASAIAANQTMAMITRLQEEKAAMQMEALQYQRMMEEQSEYDQEALQLLNELMVKREKEKQELEKELELYRKKVLHYEARERRMRKTKASENGAKQMLNHQLGRMSSASSSGGDSDELSADFNDGDDGSDTILDSNQSTPGEAVQNSSNEHENAKQLTTFDESLADFERERLSILEQLKALEEKLLTLSDEESESIATMNQITGNPDVVVPEESFELTMGSPSLAEARGGEDDVRDALCGEEAILVVNGNPDHLTCNGKHPTPRKYDGPMPKQLLPLFDAASYENGNQEQEEDASFPHSDIQLCKHIAIEEEVEQVYERLQALEADGEFLKHCINSLKKGDKGMGLLQEILQHLRDLRAVELRAKNVVDATPF